MASTTTDDDLNKEYDAVQSIWKQQDDHVAASKAARVPLPKRNIGVRRGSPTPQEDDGTREPDTKRRVASPTVRNHGRSLDLSGLPGTPIKPEQVKPAPRGGSANKSLFEPPELPERKPSFEALDSSMLGEDSNLPELHEEDEKWLEQTFINEESMDTITDWKHGEMSLFETLTEEELHANEIMNRMDSGDLSHEEGEKMIRLIVRDLNLAGRQATLQSDILEHYLDKPCAVAVAKPVKKALKQHIKIKF